MLGRVEVSCILVTLRAEKWLLYPRAAAQLLGNPFSRVSGKEARRQYFERGLTACSNLKLELVEVLRGVSSAVLYYMNQRGTHMAEFMEFDAAQQSFAGRRELLLRAASVET